jgi:hypothetical protein
VAELCRGLIPSQLETIMGQGAIVGALIGAAVVAVIIFIAILRKMPAATAPRTARQMTLESPLPPQAVFEKLKNGAWRCIKVHDSDPDRLVVVLASSVTVFSYGFFYPVFIAAKGSGSTLEVGIKSRAVQWGPVVTHNHKAAVAEIEQALRA